MEDKVLVTIIVPLIEKKYEVFLPVNKKNRRNILFTC